MAVKVLIVEDDVPTLELMQETLTSQKAEVRSASDGEQATKLINEERFDGIFLDLQMPKTTGFEVIRRIRHSSWNKSTPVIIVTASDEHQVMQKAFGAGASFFLPKPIDRYKLINLFKALRGPMLDNRRRFIRVPLKTEVACQVERLRLRGMSVNISQSGMLLELGRTWDVGTKVKLSFRIPAASSPMEVGGIVVRTDNEKRTGIQFTSLGSGEMLGLRAFLGNELPD